MSKREVTWKSVTLGEFMDFKNGVNADKGAYGNGVKFINVMDIFRHPAMRYDDVVGHVEISPKQHEVYSVVAGDILFNRTSETRNEIAFSSVYLDDEPITFGGFVIRGRQRKRLLDPHYAVYCFSQESIRCEMIRRCQGAVRANIGQSELNGIPIKIPPLREQRKIAAILCTWDEAIEKLEQAIVLKERRFQWLRWRLMYPTSGDMKRKLGSFLKESRIPDEVNDPQKRLTIRLHFKGVTVRDYRGTESRDATKYFRRSAGQLIYGKQSIFRGSIGVVPEELDGYASSQDIPTFDIDQTKINAGWLLWYMSNPHFYEMLEHYAVGSASKRLHPSELFKRSISMPNLKKQEWVTGILDEAWGEIVLLQKQKDSLATQKRGLMQKLLTGEWQVTLNPKAKPQRRSTMPDKRDYWTQQRSDGKWESKAEGAGRASKVTNTQAEAWNHSKQMARQKQGEAYLKGRDGKIRERNTYGHDPKKIKG